MPENQAAALVVDDPVVSTPEPQDKVDKSELDTLKEQIENSKQELERERLRAEAAERQSQEYSQKLSAESTERVRAQGDSIESRIAAKQAEADRLKREIKEAHENGKFDEYAELVADYGIAKQDIKGYENYKSQLAAQEEARTQAIQNDPLAKYSPKERKWINEHPEFLSDPRFQAKVTNAHYEALADGVKTNTDEYFDYINDVIDPKKKVDTDDSFGGTPTPKRVSTALPPSRAGSSSTTSGQNKQMRLSAEEVEFAMLSFPKMSAADAQNEYYKNKMELISSGKMGRN